MGIVQGLTEFIPVSSSGHLVIFPKVLGWEEGGLAFDTTLHLGTLTALVVYFFGDLKRMAVSFVRDLISQAKNFGRDTNLLLWLVLATVPAGLAGLLLENFIESRFRSILSVAFFLLLGSALMYFADKKIRSKGSEPTQKNVFAVGLFQCLALFPGFSRSGATISGGLLMGFNRELAARISFLLSLPVIAAAGLIQLPDALAQFSGGNLGILAMGFSSSAAAGYLSVYALLKFLKKNGLKVFIFYRVALGVFLILLHYS